MQHYLLSALIIVPLLAAITVVLLNSHSSKSKYVSLISTIIQFVFLLFIFQQYDIHNDGLQLVEKQKWLMIEMGTMGSIQALYFIGVDGLSLPLIALSVFVMAIATVSSWGVEKNRKGYFSLLLILNASVIGSFVAQDFLLFYLFFEFMLLPMFFLIGIWGGSRREYASIKFFLYTLLGSILILIVLIALLLSGRDSSITHTVVHTFSLVDLKDTHHLIPGSVLHPTNTLTIMGVGVRTWAFLFLLIGFAIKLPMVPFHTWLPDAHVEASTPISVILAALLLKIGGYGILRIVYPVFPDIALQLSWLVGIFGVVSIIYGALNAMACKDLKRLIAYSSVSHMGFVLLGIASVTTEGVAGAAYQMISHGIISAMLFLIAGVLYDRTNDRLINNYSGLYSKMPVYFTFTLIAFFASLGLPGLSGFMAEFLVLVGSFTSNNTNGLLHASLAIVATLGLVLSAAYYLWTMQRMFFGKFDLKGGISADRLYDLTLREKIMLFPLATITIILGILPQLLLIFLNSFAHHFSSFVLSAGKTILDSFTP